jgi:hypothetical protein
MSMLLPRLGGEGGADLLSRSQGSGRRAEVSRDFFIQMPAPSGLAELTKGFIDGVHVAPPADFFLNHNSAADWIVCRTVVYFRAAERESIRVFVHPD